MKRLIWMAVEGCAWVLCEIAFRTDCWGPFAWFYRAGNWLYRQGDMLGRQWGFLVPNPRFGQPDQPEFVLVPNPRFGQPDQPEFVEATHEG